MRMYRQTPPEYRALVVENERDFRRELVYLVESMDFGISVTGEAADYDEALALLEEEAFDLLITDVNLTDAPRFEVGQRDGIALAVHARSVLDIPTIFLTAFADYDPTVVTLATACDPIGFIQKQGDSLSAQTQSLIRLALRRLDAARREREARQQLEAVIEQVGRALLYIDGEGFIMDFSDAAAVLLEQPPDALVDAHWEDVLRIEAPLQAGRSILARAITDGSNAQLSALALLLPGGRTQLVSALVLPAEHLREPCTLVLLRDLAGEQADIARLRVAEGSSLALVGIFEDPRTERYDATDLRIAMLDLHALLLARVRAADTVTVAAAAMIAVQMPDTGEPEGVAIIASLVSDIERSLRRRHHGLQLRAGVAHRRRGQSIAATAAAALDALDGAQRGGDAHVVGAGRSAPVPRRREYMPADTRPLLDRGFAVTEAVLRIPLREGRSLSELGADFGAAIAAVPGLLAFGTRARGADGATRWLLGQRLDAEAGWRDCREAELPAAVLAALDSDAARDPGGLRLLYFDEMSLSLSSVRGPGGLDAVAFLLAHHSGPPGRVPTDREKDLSAVAARHLAQLIERCTDYAPGAVPVVPVSTPDYNPWALQRQRQVLAELRLLLVADTPATLVSEPGMERAGLLAEAVDQWQPESPWPVVELACELWPEHCASEELLEALQVPPQTVLLLREPQHLPRRTQVLLGEALRRRALPVGGSAPPLPSLRFAATLPDAPAALVARGELTAELASALDAGVLRIAPLRDNAVDCRRWAEALLDAECALARVPARRFAPEALTALGYSGCAGNIAELRERVRRAVAQSATGIVSALDLGLLNVRAVP